MLFQHLQHYNPLRLLLKLITLAATALADFSERKKIIKYFGLPGVTLQ